MKMPPVQKVYEAYTAIADGRVHLGGDANQAVAGTGVGGIYAAEGSAQVVSSSGEHTYTVQWEGDSYASDDNGTYWQGYPGYPVIAVLMLQNRLPCDLSVARRFAGVPWHELNEKHRRDYDAALQEACAIGGLGVEEARVCTRAANHVYVLLEKIDLHIKRKV